MIPVDPEFGRQLANRLSRAVFELFQALSETEQQARTAQESIVAGREPWGMASGPLFATDKVSKNAAKAQALLEQAMWCLPATVIRAAWVGTEEHWFGSAEFEALCAEAEAEVAS